MKLKYYLRGLGIGIIVTTIILMISFSKREVEISDEEVIARAIQLGMVMQEEETDTSPEDGEQATETENGQQPADPAADPQDGTSPEDGGQDTAVPEPDADQEAEAPEGVYRLVIQKGDVCRVVCENLAENGVISDAETMRKYLFEIGYASNMSIGEYDIPYGLTNEQVAEILQAGPMEN